MKSTGKLFEESFKKSIPDYALLYRLPDSAQVFNKNNNLRFSRKNPFDFLLWDSKRHILYALELKSVKGKSISFERAKGECGEIHFHQIKGLTAWNKYNGIVCGFIIEFREIETTVFIDIDSFNVLMTRLNKKSFNYYDLIKEKMPFIIIPQEKKRTRYSYDVDVLLKQIKT